MKTRALWLRFALDMLIIAGLAALMVAIGIVFGGCRNVGTADATPFLGHGSHCALLSGHVYRCTDAAGGRHECISDNHYNIVSCSPLHHETPMERL